MDLFPSSGEGETSTLLGPVERANLNHQTTPVRFTLSVYLLFFILLPNWNIGYPLDALFHFSFLILGQSVGLPERGISPSQAHYLHRTTQCALISVFERAKTVYALDRAVTVIGLLYH
jgi:hypothetical protein